MWNAPGQDILHYPEILHLLGPISSSWISFIEESILLFLFTVMISLYDFGVGIIVVVIFWTKPILVQRKQRSD